MLDGRSETIVIITSIFLAISLVTVLLRCFVRVKIVRAFGWDDQLMVLAMILNVAFAICGIVGAYYGLGRKLDYFMGQPDRFHGALLCWWLGEIFYVVTCVVAKLSIVLTLLRVVVERIHSWILYAAMTITVIVGMLFLFFTIFQCHPVSFFWTRLPNQPGACINPDILLAIVYVYSVGAAVTDFTIGLLPVFLIWNLRMNLRAKVAIACVLGIGCIASSAVIIRIPYLHNYKDPEFLYATTSISIWSNVEAGLGITAGSLTTLRPLIRLLFDGVFSSPRGHGPDSLSLALPSIPNNNSINDDDDDDDNNNSTGGMGDGGEGGLMSRPKGNPDPRANAGNHHGMQTVIKRASTSGTTTSIEEEVLVNFNMKAVDVDV